LAQGSHLLGGSEDELSIVSAALFAFVATPTAVSVAQNALPRTGEKSTKTVQVSCPVHPDVKARSAGRCPKCRAAERRLKVYREKDKNKVNQPQ
jgi:hypothetical protein